MSDDLNKQMRIAAMDGRTAEMNGLLDRGAEVHSTDSGVSRPSAAAGLAPPPQAPEAPSAPLAPAAAATTAPSPHTAGASPRAAPAAGCAPSLRPAPLPLRLTAAAMPPRRAARRSTARLATATMAASTLS